MQDAVMSGLFGAMTAEMRLNISSNNLANINTTGYKRDRVSFQDTFMRMATDLAPDPRGTLREKRLLPTGNIIAKPRIAEQSVDLSQGSFQVTGNNLDVAISGKGFFKVVTPDGTMYTRNGEFYRNSEGLLVDTKGYPVVGGGGNINLPDSTRLSVTQDGRIIADGQEIGSLEVVSVADETTLTRYGQNYYMPVKGRPVQETAVSAADTFVMQGYLEKPNVEVVGEMVAMIETQRSFEAYQKVITSANEMDANAIRSGERTG